MRPIHTGARAARHAQASVQYSAMRSVAAGAIIGSLPVIAVFAHLQKYLVSYLTAGAVKG